MVAKDSTFHCMHSVSNEQSVEFALGGIACEQFLITVPNQAGQRTVSCDASGLPS